MDLDELALIADERPVVPSLDLDEIEHLSTMKPTLHFGHRTPESIAYAQAVLGKKRAAKKEEAERKRADVAEGKLETIAAVAPGLAAACGVQPSRNVATVRKFEILIRLALHPKLFSIVFSRCGIKRHVLIAFVARLVQAVQEHAFTRMQTACRALKTQRSPMLSYNQQWDGTQHRMMRTPFNANRRRVSAEGTQKLSGAHSCG